MKVGSLQPRKGAPSRGRLFLCLLFLATTAIADDRPNIVVIMSDDHAQWAVGAYGMEEIRTPSIDAMAADGVLFANAYSPAPVCSPARASFFTGKMPSQHGIHDYLSERPEYEAGWLEGETLLSEQLQDAGYRTALIGKWHGTTDSRPPQRGFDLWISYTPYLTGFANQYVKDGTVSFSRNGDVYEHTGVQAEHLTQEAINFIDHSADQPFFVSLNFAEPHEPFEGVPERLVKPYRGLTADLIRTDEPTALSRRETNTMPDDHPEKLAQYLAAITLLDEQVGRVIDALRTRGLLDNTIVVYTSDHGLMVGQYGLYGKSNATNPPNFYEETIRIPLVVLAPDRFMGELHSRREFVDLIDLHATVLDYAEIEPSCSSDCGPGMSMAELIAGAPVATKTIQIAERGNARMVTDGRWKLVTYYERDTAKPTVEHWYDLSSPLREQAPSDPPDDQTVSRFENAQSYFFERYSSPETSGLNIWNQPMPNARMRSDLGLSPD